MWSNPYTRNQNSMSVGVGNSFITTPASFTVDIDFVAGTALGGTQPYGNNTNDGRLFRDAGNNVASFCPPNADGTGTLVSVGSAGIRRTVAGQWSYTSLTNRCLWNRDLTQSGTWTASNMTTAKTSVGADGSANAATRLTASAGNATILQTVTLASGQVVFSFYIKRITGTGNVDFTVDGGSTWTTKTITTSYTLQFITQAAVTNPQFGIRLVTSGDAVDVDFGELIVPANSTNIPKRDRCTVTTANVLNSQSRPTADIADLAPNTLITMARAPFAFYWQGRSERGNGAKCVTGATSWFVSINANNVVSFASGGGSAATGNNAFNVGLGSTNKIAGYYTAGGVIKLCVNGGSVFSSTGATSDAAMDHFDLSTNGAGSNSIYGVTERFKMGAGYAPSDADLVLMTT